MKVFLKLKSRVVKNLNVCLYMLKKRVPLTLFFGYDKTNGDYFKLSINENEVTKIQ